MCKALRSEVCSRRNNKILPHTPIRKACRPAPAIPSGRTCGAALHRRAALCADYGAGMVRGCGHPPRWNSSGDAVAGKTTVFRCKKAMIFVRKSRVFDRFLHEIARFSRVFGVLFLPVRTYRTGRRPGHSLRSWCIFYRRRYCRLVCGRCGGPYSSVWPTSRNTRHVQGLAARAAILNDRGADRQRNASPAGRGLFASTTKADRRHNGKPVQSLRYFRAWDRSAFGKSAEFGAFPCDCGTIAGDILRGLAVRAVGLNRCRAGDCVPPLYFPRVFICQIWHLCVWFGVGAFQMRT